MIIFDEDYKILRHFVPVPKKDLKKNRGKSVTWWKKTREEQRKRNFSSAVDFAATSADQQAGLTNSYLDIDNITQTSENVTPKKPQRKTCTVPQLKTVLYKTTLENHKHNALKIMHFMHTLQEIDTIIMLSVL